MNRIFLYISVLVSAIILLFVNGCESDPIVLNPDGGYILDVFNTDSSYSYSQQDTTKSIGESSRLYIGDDTKTLIRVNSDVLSLDTNYCSVNGIDSLLSTSVKLIPTNEQTILDTTKISATLISLSNIWSEEDISISLDDSTIIANLQIDTTDNELSISFGDSEEYLSNWCDENSSYAILLEYIDSDSLLEFYSSNHSTENESPSLIIDYLLYQETEIDTVKYEISDFDLLSSNRQFSVDTVVTSEDYGLVRAIFDTLETQTEDTLIINQIYTEIDLFQFELDTVFHYLDSTKIIDFMLENVELTTVDLGDFSGDDYDEVDNQDGTEGNNEYDVGEYLFDYGINALPDSLEADTSSVDNYNIDPNNDDEDEDDNPDGTEGNNEYDFGEQFLDCGSDGIPDSLEAENSPNDNYHETDNPDGTEGNNEYDDGEPFLDTGIDSLWSEEEVGFNPFGTEGNGIWDWEDLNENGEFDVGEGENWEDCGVDSLCNANEEYVGGSEIEVEIGNYTYSANSDNNTKEIPQDTSSVDVALWISSIVSSENGKLVLTISALAKLPVLDVEFQLTHTPFNYEDTLWVEQNDQLTSIDDEKLIDDISLYEITELADTTGMTINYSDRIESYLYFPEFDNFIVENLGTEKSYADLSFYVNEESELFDDMKILLFRNGSEDYVKSFEISDALATVDLTDYIQKCVNGTLDNDTLKLISSDEFHNFSRVTFENENSTDDTLRFPKLEILYTK